MQDYFVGLDVHKQVIAYCIKTPSGEIVREGIIAARRESLDQWVTTVPKPWHGGLEATMFSHWIYRHLEPHAARMKATSALRESAGRQMRGPLFKQRNRYLQSVLIEASKLAPRSNALLREVHRKALQKGAHKNCATPASRS